MTPFLLLSLALGLAGPDPAGDTLVAGGDAGSSGEPDWEVVARALTPTPAPLGGEVWERLVVLAAEGLQLDLTDADGDEVVEARGEWGVSRASDGAGGVVWTFTRSLTPWRAGSLSTPSLAMDVRDAGGRVARTPLPGLPLEVASPIPEGARVVRPAGPLAPDTRPPLWAGLLVAIPALTAVGSGVMWWSRRDAQRPPASAAPPAADPAPAPSMDEALVLAEGDPRAGAVACARALRAHPALVAAGVERWHTTSQLLTLLEPTTSVGVASLLALADEVKFGGRVPTLQDLLDAVACLPEEVRHG